MIFLVFMLPKSTLRKNQQKMQLLPKSVQLLMLIRRVILDLQLHVFSVEKPQENLLLHFPTHPVGSGKIGLLSPLWGPPSSFTLAVFSQAKLILVAELA